MKLVYSFINFIIPLRVTYVRYSWCNYQILLKSKYRELLDYSDKKIAEALPR